MGTLQVPTTGTVSGVAMATDINTGLAATATDSQSASAPTTSTTGLPSTAGLKWHDTSNNQLKIRDQADTVYMVAAAIDETNKLYQPANTIVVPQGRLTLSSNTPVQNASVAGATTVYYSPYVGALVPIFTGTYWFNLLISQLSLVLDTSGHIAGNLYDVFLYWTGSAVAIGTGPAWTNSTTRSAAISQLNGRWVNSASITLRNNSVNASGVATNTALYVGTIYATANGQTSHVFSATGAQCVLGVYNAYNREPMQASQSDGTSSWTYATATWRAARGQSTNSILFVDGLQQSFIRSNYISNAEPTVSDSSFTSVGIDSTSSPNFISQLAITAGSGAPVLTLPGENVFLPQIGAHTLYALEDSPNSATITFQGGANVSALRAALKM